MYVEYDEYVGVARCSLKHYVGYAKIFYILYSFMSILCLALTALTTILHAIPGYDELGYLVGFAASFVVAINSLVPFRDASRQSSESSVLLARHLSLQKPLHVKTLYYLANTSTLWLMHPTSKCRALSVRHHGAVPPSSMLGPSRASVPRKQSAMSSIRTVSTPRAALQPNGQTRGQVSRSNSNPASSRSAREPSTLTNASNASMHCAITKFDRLAAALYTIYYTVMTLQIILTTLTALFHSFDSMSIIDVSSDAARTLGIVSGGIATLIAGFLTAFPVEVCARQCRNAYALSFEYYVTKAPVPESVLDQLYEVDTLCFQNPMYVSNCPSPEDHRPTAGMGV